MGNIAIHSQKEPRFICHECQKTFRATTGTAYYRLHTAVETVSRGVTLLAPGCPVQAIVAAWGFDERTVAAWWARSGRQGQAIQEYLVNHGTWGRCKPMSSASRHRAALCRGRWP